jgi:glycosidase
MREPRAIAADGPDWVRDAVFYQVFIDRFHNGDPSTDPADVVPWDSAPTPTSFFGGDLAGLEAKLSYLEELGVTALYLTPIFEAGSNHRYDTHDYLSVDPVVGDATALRSLVDSAHARGIKVILDGVFNHVGDGFWAFRDLVSNGEDSAFREWFYAPQLPLEQEPPNYQTCGGASFLPKLNTGHPAVREHLLDVATHWIKECGLDGWRLDVPWKVPLDFWRAFRAHVKQELPSAYLVGEAWWGWGDLLRVFDGLMNYRVRSALLDFCVFEDMDAEDFLIELQHALAESGGGSLMLNLLGSHDTPRLMTLAKSDVARVLLSYTALFTLPGVPMVYYGDEVGMEGGEDPDCRRPMQWDSDRWCTDVKRTVQMLAQLRAEHRALRRGSFEPLAAFNRVLAFRRVADQEDLIVLINAGVDRADFTLSASAYRPRQAFRDLLNGQQYEVRDDALLVPRLAARSALILEAVR